MPNLSTDRWSTRRRQDEALRLRDAGWSLNDIRLHLGYGSGTGAVSRAINAARTRQGLPTTNRTRGTGRRFGVEVEFTGISQERAAQALRDAGLQAEVQGYNHRVQNRWKVITDASCGNEAVSPILRGEAGLAELKTALKALREAGARTTLSCGMHVHHDMAPHTGAEIARFVELWHRTQDAIDSLVAPSRRNGRNSYCARMTDAEATVAAESFRTSRTAGRVYSRFKTLNVAAFPKYGTIEVRQHQGTLNGTKAVAWVRTVWAMLDAVAAGTNNLVRNDAFLADLVEHSSLPAATGTYLAGRAAELSGAVR